MRYFALGLLLLLPVACSDDRVPTDSTTTTAAAATGTQPGATTLSLTPEYPPAPEVPDGPLGEEASEAVDQLLAGVLTSDWEVGTVDGLVEAGDPRTAWLIADLLRFYQTGFETETLASAFANLTDAEWDPGEVEFVWASNHLIAWDLPAWDDYGDAKRQIFSPLEPTWDRFFAEDHGVDWRLVTWGGVLADERPLGDNGPCNCIPSLDDPATTDAAGGDWYADDRIVFGVVVDGEALALPKHQMEVHEMVNTTLGGRDIGIPYCTLCGSAQAYFTDNVPGFDRVVLRTSGLLSRSNKLMYDLTTRSAIDTFTGEALTGPLGEAGVMLEQTTVVASTWGDWKQAHPGTLILAEDGGIGRVYADDPLGGRDDGGPIFPVGDVDPRLPVQENVVGVVTPDGTPVAFPVSAVRANFEPGDRFEYEGVTVRVDDGIRFFDPQGSELPSHQAFWFAWSQFHSGTVVWSPSGP